MLCAFDLQMCVRQCVHLRTIHIDSYCCLDFAAYFVCQHVSIHDSVVHMPIVIMVSRTLSNNVDAPQPRVSQTQVCEGVNSIIRWLCERNRRIGLVLLSARTVMRKALGLGARGCATGWRAVRPIASAVLDRCAGSYVVGVKHVLVAAARWEAPKGDSSNGPSVSMINEVIFRAEPVLNWKLKAWGSAYNADIHREFNKVSSRVCMSIAPSGPNASVAAGDNVYMVVDKSGQISQVAQCTVYPVEHLTGIGVSADEYVMGDDDRFVVIIDRPFKFIFVADLIAEIYPKFSAMDVKMKALYKHDL